VVDLPDPILPGWFEPTDDGRLRLLAQRCGPSGVVVFPRRARSVHCRPDELEDTALSVEAELWSWTVADVGMPVMIAQAKFPDGPVVQGYLQGDPARPPEIGAVVEVVPHVVPLPPKGETGEVHLPPPTATTYAFRVKES
jgi:uncharacterized OB-fold protein